MTICKFSALLSPLWDKHLQPTKHCYLHYGGVGGGVGGGGVGSGGSCGGSGGGGFGGGGGRVMVVA